MKVLLQTEVSECGLASLAMVSTHHGLDIDLRTLRSRFSISRNGLTLSRLAAVAGQLGFRARPLRLELAELPQLETPCILHWDLNHFVVLAKAGKSRVTIFDPAFGKRTLTHPQVSGHFTGVALELTPTADFRPGTLAPALSLRQLTGNISGLWRALALVVLLSLVLQVFVVLGPFFLQWVVDQVLVSADRDLLAVLALGFGLLLLLRIGTGLLRAFAVVYLSTRLGLQWMGNVFAHLLKLPLDFFEKRHLGDVISRVGSVRTIRDTLTTRFVEALIDGMMAAATFAMMLVYSWTLALVTLTAVAMYLAIRAVCFRPLREGTEQQLLAAAKQQSHLLESIRGMQSVKVAGVEPQRECAYANLMHDTVNREVWLAKFGMVFTSASGLVFGVERIAVISIGTLLALENVFSVGMLIAYLAYKDQFAVRIGALIDKWIELRMLRLHGERLADIVVTPPEQNCETIETPPLPHTGIEVRNVSFRYAEGEPWVLQNCSFSVRQGEAIAIAGASGCGKTTLVKLLLGLLQPTEGSIAFGGQDLAKIGLQNYRRMVGAVMQDDRLFAGSVADNIAFGDNCFEPRRVEAAARVAAVHDEIAAMPLGYHSLIGDMGTALSGGQQQRVILARALYRKPRILFLDEATSHLDVRRERLVNQRVQKLKLTKVIVAHRPETIASAERILVMQDGRIARELRPRPAAPSAAAAKAAAAAA
ncbi:MAG: peptidase domain-containing ABC transporter [Woeseiaceae bacterium]